MTDISLVYITCSQNEAKKISRDLVTSKYAACVNIVSGILSIYPWEGALQETTENMLIVKTETSRVEELCEFVREIHSYDQPEIIALPITHSYEGYINWVKENSAKSE